jgi:hypothetical protein
MPLHDHFQLPFGNIWPWSSVHNGWAMCITQHLNQRPLPPGYYALPSVHLGGQAQVDVATIYREEEERLSAEADGGVATAVWAPPQPPVVLPIDFSDPDVFEVQVHTQTGDFHLVAAIELVSPANKDRPGHRRAFAAKCVAYLQQNIGLVIVDVVTERRENLHAELMQMLDLGPNAVAAASSDLYAVSYRTTGTGEQMRLEVWPVALAVGGNLPTLPLWIDPEFAVPLDLEASYAATCQSLRIRP